MRYLHHGEPQTARANAEVILSGGAVNSPQLLMLSGIGPAEHLIEMGIDVHADLRGVGGNLSDHPVLPVIWSTPKIRGLWEKASNTSLLRWQLTHRGPLTSNVAESGGFAHSEPGLPAPDLQLHVLPAPYQNQGLADPARRAMTVLVGLVDVASRGRIRLRSADPRHRPAIDPGYLSDERDGRALAAGLKLAREFVTARPMAAICSSELAPGAHVRSDAELLDYVRSSVVTLYHPVGTCTMGGDSRWNSVVDLELRVRGVTGLRVVDASVMPVVPRGNTNAPTIAIAERAADLIAGRAPLAAVDPADPVDAMVLPARPRPQRPRHTGTASLNAPAARRRAARPVQPSVQQRHQRHDPPHVPVRPVERGQRDQRPHPLPRDGLGPGELAQPVRAVDPAEPGLAHPAERQRRHAREPEHGVDRGHPGPQRAGRRHRGRPVPGEHRRPEPVARRRWRARPPSSSSATGVTVTVGPNVSSVTAADSSGTSVEHDRPHVRRRPPRPDRRRRPPAQGQRVRRCAWPRSPSCEACVIGPYDASRSIPGRSVADPLEPAARGTCGTPPRAT